MFSLEKDHWEPAMMSIIAMVVPCPETLIVFPEKGRDGFPGQDIKYWSGDENLDRF